MAVKAMAATDANERVDGYAPQETIRHCTGLGDGVVTGFSQLPDHGDGSLEGDLIIMGMPPAGSAP
jgi:hypothetical protein